jgi:hypothetical protein
MCVRALLVLILLPALAAPQLVHADDPARSLEEQHLITIPPEHLQPITLTGTPARGGYAIVIAADGSRAAYIARVENKHFVVVGSEKGPELEGEITGLQLSRDGKTVIYVLAKADSTRTAYINHKPIGDGAEIKNVAMRDLFMFSPDRTRIAAVMQTADKDFVIIDGQRSPDYPFNTVYIPTFSPDSKHFTYNVNQGAKCSIVVDGKPGPEFRGIDRPVFSSDSAHMAYAAAAPFNPDKPRYGGTADWHMVVDGIPGPLFDGVSSPTFGPDNTSLAYVATVDKKNFIVFNGKQGPQFDVIYGGDGITFSPDSKRVAYSAKQGEKTVMVVDDRIGPPLDSRAEFLFSPDSTRYAYKGTLGEKEMLEELLKEAKEGSPKAPKDGAKKGLREVLIDNGQPVGEFDKIVQGSLVFSPDSATLGCAATVGGKSFILLNGKKGIEYDGNLYGPVFSRDGTKVAYSVNRQVPGENRGFVVVNDEPGPEFEGVSSPVFSPDSKHMAYIGVKGGKQFMVLDGTHPHKPTTVTSATTHPTSPPSLPRAHTHTTGPEFEAVRSPAFTADGRHLTYHTIVGREIWWRVIELP